MEKGGGILGFLRFGREITLIYIFMKIKITKLSKSPEIFEKKMSLNKLITCKNTRN